VFDELWIQPAAGDSGAALGAALDVYHNYFDHARQMPDSQEALQQGSYWGPAFSDEEIEAFLTTYDLPYQKIEPHRRPAAVAAALVEGKVVGHFSGRTEFGPRALGARSIIGDARDPEMQVTINQKIKYRESFRPFAPTVLVERIADYFELDRPSPYMLIVAPVKTERRKPWQAGQQQDLLAMVRSPRSDIPAITHVDYSARVQSISRVDNPDYYQVIEAFEARTGFGVIINTSFNVRGEPIVNTPSDAYRCFMHTEMDVLFLGPYRLEKGNQAPWPKARKSNALHARPRESERRLRHRLARIFREQFLPLLDGLEAQKIEPLLYPFGKSASTWQACSKPASPKTLFAFPQVIHEGHTDEAELAKAIVAAWSDQHFARQCEPVICSLLQAGGKQKYLAAGAEAVPESIYVMF
jgi:carbamoyltransferase